MINSVLETTKTYESIMGQPFQHTTQLSQFQILQVIKDKQYYYNIGRSLVLSQNEKNEVSYFGGYTVGENENGDLISGKIYGTTYYGWILAFFNDVQNPFESLYPGQTLKILNSEYIPTFLNMLNNLKS